jgi:hypothetical protein
MNERNGSTPTGAVDFGEVPAKQLSARPHRLARVLDLHPQNARPGEGWRHA